MCTARRIINILKRLTVAVVAVVMAEVSAVHLDSSSRRRRRSCGSGAEAAVVAAAVVTGGVPSSPSLVT